jgi:hypothetical protein
MGLHIIAHDLQAGQSTGLGQIPGQANHFRPLCTSGGMP